MGQLLKPKKTEITDKLRQEINKARAPLALRSRAALGIAPGGSAGQAGAAPLPGPAAGAQPCRLRQAVADKIAAG